METAYVIYSLMAVLGLLLNGLSFVLRLRNHPVHRLRGTSEEHNSCLKITDLILTFASSITLLGTLQDVAPKDRSLCELVGFCTLSVMFLVSWTPLLTAIILYEKERYILRMKSYQGMTSKIVIFIASAMLVISIALVSINYAPITQFDHER